MSGEDQAKVTAQTPDATPQQQPELGEWQALAVSVPGALHKRAARPNQDACLVWPSGGAGPPLVLAVADGHGGPTYTRSHVGARMAVETAVHVLGHELLAAISKEADEALVEARRLCREQLPQVLVRQWKERVEEYTRDHPFCPEEGEAIPPPQPDSRLSNDPLLVPYGSTLVAALLTQRFHIYVQLGDGDILVVGQDGVVSRPPLPEDPRLLANETTSLCNKEAWRNVRLHFQPILDAPPALVLLATDGYANSFEEEEGFRQVASDLFSALREPDGASKLQAELPGWLAATSAAGSGDDISVALAWAR